MTTLIDMARAMSRPPEYASPRQRLAGALLLVIGIIALGAVPQ